MDIINNLIDWIKSKQNLDSVSMIRTTFKDKVVDYSLWKIDKNYCFLFDNDGNISKILFNTDSRVVLLNVK